MDIRKIYFLFAQLFFEKDTGFMNKKKALNVYHNFLSIAWVHGG